MPPRLAVAVVLLLLTPVASAGTRFVDASATGANDGSSWADAFTSLQAALGAAVAGDELWVAAGTYTPAGPGGSTGSTFAMPPDVSVYGGFAGGEASLAERDPLANPTVLSGDLDGDDLPAWMNRTDNALHVVTAAGPAGGALDGVTVRGGYAPAPFGAGLSITGGSFALRRCIITDNLASLAGGIASVGAALTLADCTLSGNRAWTGRGGALYVSAGGSVDASGCLFTGNVATSGAGVCDGGAVFLEGGSTGRFERCVFTSNTSSSPANPNYANGGALASLSDDLTIVGCDFRDNDAQVGGALGLFGDSTVVNCRFTGNDSLVGGAVFNFSNVASYVNCVAVDNDAGDGGGFANGFGSDVTIANSIVWGNTSPGQPTSKAQVHDLDGGDSTIRYSCVQALLETIPGEDPPNPNDFPGSIDDDPLFANAGALELWLAPGSPCIDAGDNGAVPSEVTTDLDGGSRFVDDLATADTGLGAAPVVDMGAYEFGDPWADLGDGLAGFTGIPALAGEGALTAGSPLLLTLTNARANAAVTLVVGLTAIEIPFKGGVLVPDPDLLLSGLVTDAGGSLVLGGPWPAGVPAGTTFYFQDWIVDAAGPKGLAASNGLLGLAP